MSGPLVFPVNDRTSITAPPHTVKEWTDVTMVVFDFTQWLGPDQYLSVASNVFFQTNPQANQAGTWVPFPGGGCCSQVETEPPEDINPITLAALTVLPDGRKVELSVGKGTPGLAYLASFLATAGPYPRRKEVGVVLTCYALRPLTDDDLTPPVPPATIDISGSTVLPEGASGTVNILADGFTQIIVTLPSNPVIGQSLYFKDVNGKAGDFPIIIRAPVPDLIDGQQDHYLYQNYQAFELYWTGTGWGVR